MDGLPAIVVAGLRFALGLFTNLVPDEHLDFHRTPEDYVRTKSRFFGMLEDGAPLVVNRDDERVRARTALALKRRQRPVIGVSAAGADDAAVRVESIGAIPHSRLRIVLEVPLRLTVTASEDSAGERDRVRGAEREAMLGPLRLGRVPFDYEPTLAAAVQHTVEGSSPGDLVLLLRAQGMDRAAELAREILP